ncbi:MAG: hypothetical protein ACM3NQ_03035 [Bacteroidales bacterium]
MRGSRVALIMVIPLAALLSAGAAADGRQKGHDKHGNGKEDKAAQGNSDLLKARPGGPGDAWRYEHDAWRDRDHCVVVVHDYYDRRGLPPGLAKKQSLPPGLQKQLRERGHLPPGLEKHWVMLPAPLERELPPLPPHHVRRIVGADLLVVDLHLNVVVSLWRGVI